MILVSEKLKAAGVPVTLAVTFDPVHPRPAPGNVRKFMNFYQSDNGFGTPVKAERGARVSLTNDDLKDDQDITHTTIDKACRCTRRLSAK